MGRLGETGRRVGRRLEAVADGVAAGGRLAGEVARRMEGVEGRGARLDEVVGRLGEAVRGGEERVVRRLEAVECGVADGVTGAARSGWCGGWRRWSAL